MELLLDTTDAAASSHWSAITPHWALLDVLMTPHRPLRSQPLERYYTTPGPYSFVTVATIVPKLLFSFVLSLSVPTSTALQFLTSQKVPRTQKDGYTLTGVKL